jgi:hypothetical protein
MPPVADVEPLELPAGQRDRGYENDDERAIAVPSLMRVRRKHPLPFLNGV